MINNWDHRKRERLDGISMLIDPAKTALFIPPGLSNFKANLFNRVGSHIQKRGGRVVQHEFEELRKVPDEIVPIVGCTPELRPLIDDWIARKRKWIYWDRGYCRRVFATWLPRGESGGYYRWHCEAYQLRALRDVPDDRWRAMQTEMGEWKKGGRHILIAAPTRTYSRFHRCEKWIADTLDALSRVTDRQLIIRDKASTRPLQKDLEDAHCLVTHGSNAAVEAAIMGCPVFVHPDSAAALVGQTDLSKIEKPIYPDREPWVRALSYSQFNEKELIDGTLWRLLN